MAWWDRLLKKNVELLPVPQHYNSEIDDWEVTQGSGGAAHSRIIDTHGKPYFSEANPATVKFAGGNMQHFGKTVADRPAASSVPVGAIYMAVDTQEIWQSNGSTWVVM